MQSEIFQDQIAIEQATQIAQIRNLRGGDY